MWRSLIIVVFALLLTATLSGCVSTERPNCKTVFEQNLETNIAAFVKTMPGKDSIEARRMAERALNKLYEIDSTFVFMQGVELETLIKKNLQFLIECDSTSRRF